MHCPFCQHEDTQVADSRMAEDRMVIRRRRRCPLCEQRFTTYERAAPVFPVVVKKDGSCAEFDRNKLIASLRLALRKRPIATAVVDAAVAHIEYQLLSVPEREINTTQLGEWVMDALRKIDKIAYIRFASVYRNFEDISEFQRLIKALTEKGQDGADSYSPGIK